MEEALGDRVDTRNSVEAKHYHAAQAYAEGFAITAFQAVGGFKVSRMYSMNYSFDNIFN